jgi:hypothetical protein
MPRRITRLKAALHLWLDPFFSQSSRWQAKRALSELADGEYTVPVDVPYYAQFASPERIHDYIHGGFDGTQDPNWSVFGADDPADYVFWAPRVCALACLKMAIEAFRPQVRPTLWQLVNEGLAVEGYTVRDAHGTLIDEGWYFHAQVHLANRYGLKAVGRGYVSPLNVCEYIRNGWLVAASVTPELGERQPTRRRYGGHLVLVYGFDWRDDRPAYFLVHNPSGRFPELQAHARIPARRFAYCFAHRFVALRPA